MERKDICQRSFDFAVRIVRLCRAMDGKTGVSRTLANQLLRSGTSIGADIEEAQAGQSRADFVAKLSIVCKEARETRYWLSLLGESEVMKPDLLEDLAEEGNELVAILTSIIKNMRKNLDLEGYMDQLEGKSQDVRVSSWHFFTIFHSLFIIGLLLCSGQAFAACVTTITASTPTTDFTVNGDGTVTHTKTGLRWKRCSEGQAWSGTTCTGTATTYTWQGALQQAEILNNGGGFATFTDWRVPNIKELASIMEEQCFSPDINATIFPATVSNGYWSASPYAAIATDAWNVHFKLAFFNDAGDIVSNKSTNYYVRLVRGGQ